MEAVAVEAARVAVEKPNCGGELDKRVAAGKQGDVQRHGAVW